MNVPQACVTSILLLLACSQLILIDNLMLFKFSCMCSTNEDFWIRFLFTWNLGFAFGSETFLTLFFDHVLEKEYQYLTGQLYPNPVPFPLFWKLLVLFTGSIITIGSGTKKFKSWFEDQKDSNLVQNIKIGLGSPILNNQAQNPPLLSEALTKVLSIVIALAVASIAFLRLLTNSLFLEGCFYNANASIFGFILPITYFVTKKDFRSHLLRNF